MRGLYWSFARRHERSLDDACFLNFQARSAEARTLDANVGYALQRAKRTVDQVRQSSSDDLDIRAALGQISEWLGSAAETVIAHCVHSKTTSCRQRVRRSESSQRMIWSARGAVWCVPGSCKRSGSNISVRTRLRSQAGYIPQLSRMNAGQTILFVATLDMVSIDQALSQSHSYSFL